MEKPKKRMLLLVSGILVLVLGLLGSIALAQEATPESESPAEDEAVAGSVDSQSLRGLGHWGGFGRHGDNSNWLENLAEALGITIEQLEDAQDQAYAATVADAVAAGQITQEQADQILAKHVLQDYVDRKAILATALGMSVEDLEAALADGQMLSDLMDEKGIDSETFMSNAQAAYEAAVQQAVTDGVITQAQADEFISNYSFSLSGRGGHGGHHGGRGGRGDGEFASPLTPDSTTPDTTTPETTDTNFDA